MGIETVDYWKVTLGLTKGVTELKSESEPELVEIGGDGYLKLFNGHGVKFVPIKALLGFEIEPITTAKNAN